MKIQLFFVMLFTLFLLACGKDVTPDKVSACDGTSPENCECFQATNRERVNNDLPAYAYCKTCYKMAQDHAEDMVKNNYFSHTRPAIDGSPEESFAQRASRYGLSWGAGENIASGATGKGAVAMWMASSGHKANILHKSFKSFACGTKSGMSVQVFSASAE